MEPFKQTYKCGPINKKIIYNSSVPTQDVVWKTYQKMIGTNGAKDLGKSVPTVRHDDDDDVTSTEELRPSTKGYHG